MHKNRSIAKQLNDKTVLVIEPSVNYRQSIKQFLTNLKAKSIKAVGSVRDAKRYVISEDIGLFIVEWQLPEKNGIQFCKELRKNPKFANTPFLLLSVENLKSDVILASETGIDAYLLKPFSYEVFGDQVEKLMRRSGNPTDEKKILDLADELLEANQLNEAQAMYEKIIKERANSARAYLGLAKISRRKQDLERALDYSRHALNLNPEFLSAYIEVMELYEEKENFHGVLSVALKLAELSPDNPRYWLKAAFGLLQIGELKKSEEYFRKTIRYSPTIAEAFKGLGDIYMQQEEYDKAKKNYSKALDLDANDVRTLNSLGLANVKSGEIEVGIAKYNAALKIEPKNPRILFNIGYAYEKLEDYDLSSQFYNKALFEEPTFAKAKRGLQRVNSKSSVAAS